MDFDGILFFPVTPFDARGRVVHSNDFLLETTGRSRAETTGKDWFELFVPVDQRPAKEEGKRDREQGEEPDDASAGGTAGRFQHEPEHGQIGDLVAEA